MQLAQRRFPKSIYYCYAKPKLFKPLRQIKFMLGVFNSCTGKTVILKVMRKYLPYMLSSKRCYDQYKVKQHSVFCDRVD